MQFMNQAVTMLLVAACVDVQERLFASTLALDVATPPSIKKEAIAMVNLTDRVICVLGFGPEDWSMMALDNGWVS